MSKKQDYIVRADGWVAGKWQARGSTVSLTKEQAKYENVTLKKDEAPKVSPGGSPDDLTGKALVPADKVAAEEDKRSRAKK